MVLVDERPLDREGQATRPDRKGRIRGRTGHDGLVAKAFDHRGRDPPTIGVRSSTVGTPEVRRRRPTSWRLAKWGERSWPQPSPPRYTIWATPAQRAAAAKLVAARRSRSSKSPAPPIEWTR